MREGVGSKEENRSNARLTWKLQDFSRAAGLVFPQPCRAHSSRGWSVLCVQGSDHGTCTGTLRENLPSLMDPQSFLQPLAFPLVLGSSECGAELCNVSISLTHITLQFWILPFLLPVIQRMTFRKSIRNCKHQYFKILIQEDFCERTVYNTCKLMEKKNRWSHNCFYP